MTEGDTGDVVRLVMKWEQIVLAALEFLRLVRTGWIFFESKDPRVYQREDATEEL